MGLPSGALEIHLVDLVVSSEIPKMERHVVNARVSRTVSISDEAVMVFSTWGFGIEGI